MNNIQVLKKLVNEKAISFISKNKKEIEEQYNYFTDTYKIIGIDLGSGEDMTVYTPHRKQ